MYSSIEEFTMNIMQIISHLYTDKSFKWIIDLDDADIQPFVIQHWLIMNDNIRIFTRWLDHFTFSLPPKMWLSLAHSVLPKYQKQPFVKYIKKNEEEEEYNFILTKIRKHYNLSDNDYNSIKTRLIKYVKQDMTEWFKFYGVEKRLWKLYYLNFDDIKKDDKIKKEVNLLNY